MKVLLLDDDLLFCKKIKSDLVEYFYKTNIYCDKIIACNEYTDITITEQIDFAFLDIDLISNNGIDIARKIKKKYPLCVIVFISAREDLVFHSLSVQPFYFIRKSNYENDMINLYDLFDTFFQEKMMKVLSLRQSKICISLYTIIYIESNRHLLTIHTTSGTYYDTHSLYEFYETIPNDIFSRVHKSYIVNMNYISQISSTELILQNFIEIPIGRKYKTDFEKKYNEFLIR